MTAIVVDPGDRRPAFDERPPGARHRVTGQRVVITGANRGLGLELARVYAQRGDEVVAGCRRPGDADELSALTSQVHELDVGSEESVEQFAAAVGSATLDVLINNAGVDGRALGVPDDERDVLQLSAEHVLDEIRINAIGPMLLSRALLGRCAAASIRGSSTCPRRSARWRSPARWAATSATSRRRPRST